MSLKIIYVVKNDRIFHRNREEDCGPRLAKTVRPYLKKYLKQRRLWGWFKW
jgi:hypothetical protein